MNKPSTKPRNRVVLEPADEGSTNMVLASNRRAIAVGDAKTIVVHPRIPLPYKAMIWFSFGLNALLVLVLLIGGAYALSLYQQAKSQLQTIQAALDMETPMGQRIQSLTADPIATLNTDPAPAIDLARSSLGDVMTSIEGLENAHIRTNIPINKQLPIELQIPVNQETAVRTTAPVPMVVPARFTLPGGGGQINGSVSLSLPAGLELPINLNMTIPVSSSVPVQFDVPIDIPLKDTELYDDFNRLHDLVEPAAKMVKAR